MPSSLGELVYTLTLNDEGFAEQTDAASAQMDTLSGSADATSASLAETGAAADDAGASMGAAGDVADESSAQFDAAKGSMLSSIAPLLAAVGAYEVIKSAISDANEVQAAQAQIKQALKSTGDASGETVASLTDLAESQSKQTDFSKAQVLQAESVALTFTNIGKNVFPSTVVAAENISQKFGIALPNAMKLVGRAIEDPTKGVTTLSRYIGVLNTSQTDQIKSMMAAGDATGAQTYLLSILAQKTGGAATAATETFAGKMKELKNEAIDKVSSALEKMATWLDKHIKLVMTIIGVIAPLVAGLLAIVTAVKIWTMAQAALNAIMDMNPILLAIMALVLITVEIVTHWNDVKQWFSDFWNWIKGVFGDIVNFVKQNWELLAAILILPLAPVLIIWKYFHDQIIEFIKDAVSVIESVWSAITGFFSKIVTDVRNAIVNGVKDFGTLLFDAGKDLIQGLINGVKNMADAAGNAVKDVGKGITDVAKKILGVFSPSTVFAEIGQNVTLGLAQGISSNTDQAVSATNDLTSSVVGAGSNMPAVSNSNSASTVQYNFGEGSVVLSTADAVDEFFSISNRSTALEINGGSPLAGTTGV